MSSYDFIIIGGGAAGSPLSFRLATSLKYLKILLIEAGGRNDDINHQILGERYSTFKTAPGYNWGYKTVPQPQLGGRELDYDRGKGLGGSTAVNFCMYTRGAAADYDRWAELVDDDTWSWKNALERFKMIETQHDPPQHVKQYVDLEHSTHGQSGPVQLSYPNAWENGFTDYLDAVYASGYPKNLDINSGNPLGMGITVSSSFESRRVTASTAYLSNAPPNLTIKTNTTVDRILFEGNKAVGVETKGSNIYASKEVIIAAGAIDSPKLLLLSGIGPATELEKHGIQTVHNLRGVGKGLRDHMSLEITVLQKPGTSDRATFFNDSEAVRRAREQWLKDRTGPLTIQLNSQAIAFSKIPRLFHSEEFKSLESSVQQELQAETMPAYELLSHCTTMSPQISPSETYLAFLVAPVKPQSVGSLHLRSPNPTDPPILDPNSLSHPFDRLVFIESVREVLAFLDQPAIATHTLRLGVGPHNRTDEAIYDYIQGSAISMWHMCGTAKMGKVDDADACVGTDFRVVGTQGLRVVDMSVAPVIPSAHTQAAAYLIGETAAEKMIDEYR